MLNTYGYVYGGKSSLEIHLLDYWSEGLGFKPHYHRVASVGQLSKAIKPSDV